MEILNYTDNILSIEYKEDLAAPCLPEFVGECPVVEGTLIMERYR